MLVVVTGVPGVGKSTVAAALTRRLRGCLLAVDVIENAMLGAGVPRGWESGVAAYEVAGALAVQNLNAGLPTIIDAVSDSQASRDTWRRAAASARASMSVVEVRLADEHEHKRRLHGRARSFSHLPEPSWDDVRDRLERYEPWDEERLGLDATRSLERLVQIAYEHVQTAG
ncbi:MAG TPA: AAA family ATPase [Egibacteraceae bacterium]|nr:AAA family ATPase [Egibacteraceae bacterium]